MGIHITNRDIQILKNINRFGFLDIFTISDLHHLQPKLAYRRMKKLCNASYVEHEHYLRNEPGVYRVTYQGTQLSGDRLSPIKKFNIATMKHDLAIAKLSVELVKKHGGEFISERELRHKKGFNGIGDTTHMPDGVLKTLDKAIAIEVELSVKGEQRIHKIIKHYRKDFDFDEVWYFCGCNEVFNKLEKIAGNQSVVKLMRL